MRNKKRLKILQIISYFYPAFSYGGPGKLVYEMSKSLKALRCDVTVFSTDAFDRSRRRTSGDNFEIGRNKLDVYFFKNLSNFLAYRYKFFLPFDCFPAVFAKTKSFDVVHIHEFFTELAILSSLLSRYYKVPYVLSAHGTLDSFHLDHRVGLKRVFMRLFGRDIIKNAVRMVAATKEEIDEYVKLGVRRERIVFIPNGINAGIFDKLPERGRFREKHKITKTDKVITYLGRINRLKGLDVLINAYARLSAEFGGRLVIAGSDDGHLGNLRLLAEKNNLAGQVIFPGVIAGRDKLCMYADTDVFVYPSPCEGFSIAILEAGAAGLPLVITRGCKFPEVEKCQAGIIAEFSERSLYASMKKMFSSKMFRHRASINARRMVKENFTIAAMADKLLKVYEDVAKTKQDS